MEAQVAEAKFKQADTLFSQSRYREALELLVELDRAFPNTKRILFPMALCLFHTDCQGEAVQLCDRLIANFAYAKASDLKARIESGELPGAYRAGAEGPSVPPDTFVPPGQDPAVPLAEPASSSRWPWYVFIGVCVAVLLGLPLVAGLMKNPSEPAPAAQTNVTASESLSVTTVDSGEPQATSEIAPELPSAKLSIGMMIFLTIVGFAINCGVLYTVIAVMGHLLHDDFASNMVDVLLTELIMGALCLIPLVGWFFALKYLANHYDLSCGELLLAVVLMSLFGLGITVAIAFLLVGSVVGLTSVGAI